MRRLQCREIGLPNRVGTIVAVTAADVRGSLGEVEALGQAQSSTLASRCRVAAGPRAASPEHHQYDPRASGLALAHLSFSNLFASMFPIIHPYSRCITQLWVSALLRGVDTTIRVQLQQVVLEIPDPMAHNAQHGSNTEDNEQSRHFSINGIFLPSRRIFFDPRHLRSISLV